MNLLFYLFSYFFNFHLKLTEKVGYNLHCNGKKIAFQ